MTGSVSIGIDGGQSGIRARLIDETGKVIGEGSAAGFTYQAGDPSVSLGAGAASAAFNAGLSEDMVVKNVVATMSGMPNDERISVVAAQLKHLRPTGSVFLSGDHVGAHAGALAGQSGVAVALGTGAFALGISPTGVVNLIDGWGYFIDDAGSAFAIGREVLRAALRHQDGRESAPLLTKLLEEQVGPAIPYSLSLFRADNPSREVARLAPIAFKAAEQGEDAAVQIIDQTADEVAKTLTAAAAGFPVARPVQYVVLGGVRNAGAPLFSRVDSALDSLRVQERPLVTFERIDPVGDNLYGASLLASEGMGRYQGFAAEYCCVDGQMKLLQRPTLGRWFGE